MDFLFWYILSLVIVYYGTAESLKRHYEAKIKEAREEAIVETYDKIERSGAN
jgi:hypothetical protein